MFEILLSPSAIWNDSYIFTTINRTNLIDGALSYYFCCLFVTGERFRPIPERLDRLLSRGPSSDDDDDLRVLRIPFGHRLQTLRLRVREMDLHRRNEIPDLHKFLFTVSSRWRVMLSVSIFNKTDSDFFLKFFKFMFWE
jgi:hypothetical protein